MTRSKTLYIHCGDFKTGTTAIQNCLSASRDLLQGYGIDYTSIGRDGEVAHAKLYEELHDFAKGLTPSTSFAQQISDQLVHSENAATIVSFEALQLVLEKGLPQWMSHLDASIRVKLIYYARPHGDVLIANYSQRAKLCRTVGSFGEFVELAVARKMFHYARRYDAFASLIGAENLIFRPYARSAFQNGDIVVDLLGTVFSDLDLGDVLIDIQDDLVRPADKNISPNRITVSVMQSLLERLKAASAPVNWPSQHVVVRQLVPLMQSIEALTAPMFRDQRLGIPEDQIGTIQAAYTSDASRLDSEVFGAEIFSPALEKLEPGLDFDTNLNSLLPDELLRVIDPLLNSLASALSDAAHGHQQP